MDDKVALYRKYCFLNCTKSWWIKLLLRFSGGDRPNRPSWIRPWLRAKYFYYSLPTHLCARFVVAKIFTWNRVRVLSSHYPTQMTNLIKQDYESLPWRQQWLELINGWNWISKSEKWCPWIINVLQHEQVRLKTCTERLLKIASNALSKKKKDNFRIGLHTFLAQTLIKITKYKSWIFWLAESRDEITLRMVVIIECRLKSHFTHLVLQNFRILSISGKKHHGAFKNFKWTWHIPTLQETDTYPGLTYCGTTAAKSVLSNTLSLFTVFPSFFREGGWGSSPRRPRNTSKFSTACHISASTPRPNSATLE